MVNGFPDPTDKYLLDLMPVCNNNVNDNKCADEELENCLRNLNETLFRGLLRDVKNVFDEIRDLPDDLGIKALEIVTIEHQATIGKIKEQINVK